MIEYQRAGKAWRFDPLPANTNTAKLYLCMATLSKTKKGAPVDATVVAAIGDQPESVSLRYLADRDFVLSLAGRTEQATMMERSFDRVIEELRQGREGAALMLSALLRVILVGLLRVSEGGGSIQELSANCSRIWHGDIEPPAHSRVARCSSSRNRMSCEIFASISVR